MRNIPWRRPWHWPTWLYAIVYLVGCALLCAATAGLYTWLHGGAFLPRFGGYLGLTVTVSALQVAWLWWQTRRKKAGR
jgi:hypothetical protein